MKYILLLLLMLCAIYVSAAPHVGYIYPSGAERGKKTQLLIGGQSLSGIEGGFVTGKGVKVVSVEVIPRFANRVRMQQVYLVDSLRHLLLENAKAPVFPDSCDDWKPHPFFNDFSVLTPMQMSVLKQELFIPRNPLQQAPSLRQLLIVEVEVAPDALPGRREFRLWNNDGFSAPKPFYVEANPCAQEPHFKAPFERRVPPVIHDGFPLTLHGQIMPGETDHFVLRLIAGKTYTFSLTAREILPYIGDAVPGHFQANMTLLDTVGRKVSFADDDYHRPDPVLRFTPSVTDTYTLAVSDNLYRGREDFVYRIEIADRAVPNTFSVGGRYKDLKRVGELSYKPMEDKFEPVLIQGVIAKPSETDAFVFYGTPGQRVALECIARAANSPLDGIMTLYDPRNRQIAQNDDPEHKFNIGSVMQNVDPYLFVELESEGWYTVTLTDVTGKGGKDYRYALRIDEPRPSFSVYAKKTSLNYLRNTQDKLKCFVVRREGFDGRIRIVTPDTFCRIDTPRVIDPKQDEFTLYIRSLAPEDRFRRAVRFNAVSDWKKKMVERVIPCVEFSQAFAYDHFVPVDDSIRFFARRKNPPPPPRKR